MSLSPAPFDETFAPRLTRRRLLAALLALGLLPVFGPPARSATTNAMPVRLDGWLLAPGDR
ncbi:hypothetical protein [Modicisalibacter tunisiensis]|uniref:Uncharacterized protein n=1 Tax=Modicisalibacter tunisiensis TaxID=390637 RepID=A0ABS7WXX4_9GAMM|nr:hypothetical protein [Modicisalibacter tunisiensis]MBZ9539121.1 hypothetical protein [Modicisalibacter tunisiensis]MBZ9567485.1 hypothetical protein [Modicisalibacter tunisiensis]